MSKKETGWMKRNTDREKGRQERMRSVSSPQPIIRVLADAPTYPCTVRDKKRAHSRFLPLHRLPCYFFKSPASLIHAARPARPPARLPSLAAFRSLPSLTASLQSCHRESRLCESLLFSPNLSVAERLELALL